MTDPGVEEMDAWANRHPRAARTLIVASIWAVLHGIALFLGWLGLGIFGGLFSGLANLLAIGWAVVLIYLNWDRVAPAIESAKEWFHVTVSRRTLRSYRYPDERSAHEEQARETTISLGLMAGAAPDDPTQTRMASDIEHGMEARLTVLIDKPKLSLAEKRERDAIQAALQARRQSFEPSAALWTPEPAPARPLALWGVSAPSLPLGWIVAAVAAIAFAVQGWFFGKATHERDEAIEAAEQMAASNQRLTEALGDASRAHATDTERRIAQARAEMEATAQEQARAASRAAQRRERNALENDPSLGPIDFGERLPNLVEPASAAGGGDGDAPGADPDGPLPS